MEEFLDKNGLAVKIRQDTRMGHILKNLN